MCVRVCVLKIWCVAGAAREGLRAEQFVGPASRRGVVRVGAPDTNENLYENNKKDNSIPLLTAAPRAAPNLSYKLR